MAFNTGNPLGSTDPRDFSDNSENLDRAVNNTASATWTDRFGNTRTSLAGQIGYIGTGVDGAIEDYAAGQVLDTFSTIIRYSGEFYRPAAGATLPYTTTATTPDIDANLVPVGDATLRQDLAGGASAGNGAALVNGATIYVGSVAELVGITSAVDGAQYSVSSYHPDHNTGGGTFVFDGGRSKSDHNGGTVIDPDKVWPDWSVDSEVTSWFTADGTGSGCFVKKDYESITCDSFGADPTGTYESAKQMQQYANTSVTSRDFAFKFGAGVYLVSTTIVMTEAAVATSYTISGEGAGQPYTGINNGAATEVKTNGNSLFRFNSGYPLSGITVEKLKMHGPSSDKSGFMLDIFSSNGHQIKNLWTDQLCGAHCGALNIESTFSGYNAPYWYGSKMYFTSGETFFKTDANTIMTIGSISETLVHGFTNYGILVNRGAELQISDSWFEGCSPRAIYSPGNNFLSLSLANVYFENSAGLSDPNVCAFESNNSSQITISGNTNLPGTFMQDNPPIVNGPSSVVDCYTVRSVPVRGIFSTNTPDKVRPHYLHQSIISYPLSLASTTGTDGIMTKHSFGGEISRLHTMAAVKNGLSAVVSTNASNTVISGTLTENNSFADDKVIYIAFPYQTTGPNFGLASSSSLRFVTIDGTNNTIDGGGFTIPAAPIPRMCVICVPLPANSTATGCRVDVAGNIDFVGVAQIYSSDPTPVAKFGPQKGILYYSDVVPAGGNFNITVNNVFGEPQKLKMGATLGFGEYGTYLIDTYGISQNGSKVRVEDNRLLAGVTASAVDSAHTDVIDVTFSNSTGSDIRIDYYLNIK